MQAVCVCVCCRYPARLCCKAVLLVSNERSLLSVWEIQLLAVQPSAPPLDTDHAARSAGQCVRLINTIKAFTEVIGVNVNLQDPRGR